MEESSQGFSTSLQNSSELPPFLEDIKMEPDLSSSEMEGSTQRRFTSSLESSTELPWVPDEAVDVKFEPNFPFSPSGSTGPSTRISTFQNSTRLEESSVKEEALGSPWESMPPTESAVPSTSGVVSIKEEAADEDFEVYMSDAESPESPTRGPTPVRGPAPVWKPITHNQWLQIACPKIRARGTKVYAKQFKLLNQYELHTDVTHENLSVKNGHLLFFHFCQVRSAPMAQRWLQALFGLHIPFAYLRNFFNKVKKMSNALEGKTFKEEKKAAYLEMCKLLLENPPRLCPPPAIVVETWNPGCLSKTAATQTDDKKLTPEEQRLKQRIAFVRDCLRTQDQLHRKKMQDLKAQMKHSPQEMKQLKQHLKRQKERIDRMKKALREKPSVKAQQLRKLAKEQVDRRINLKLMQRQHGLQQTINDQSAQINLLQNETEILQEEIDECLNADPQARMKLKPSKTKTQLIVMDLLHSGVPTESIRSVIATFCKETGARIQMPGAQTVVNIAKALGFPCKANVGVQSETTSDSQSDGIMGNWQAEAETLHNLQSETVGNSLSAGIIGNWQTEIILNSEFETVGNS